MMEAIVLDYNYLTPKPRREPVLSLGTCSRLLFRVLINAGLFFEINF